MATPSNNTDTNTFLLIIVIVALIVGAFYVYYRRQSPGIPANTIQMRVPPSDNNNNGY